MDIGRAFTFVFDDEDWIKKILIGGIVTIIPIVNFIAIGYGLRVLRNVARGDAKPLPEWDDWGGDFVKGAMVFVAGIIYALPIIVLSIISAIITAIASDAFGEVGGIGGLCILGVNCLNVLWAIAMALWMPAATIRYARSEQFGAFFEFSEIWALISNNLGTYGMAILVSIIAGIVGGLGTILCVVGVIFTSFYGTLVGMHAYGQVAAVASPPTTMDTFATEGEDAPPPF
jgi:hypothetical protein